MLGEKAVVGPCSAPTPLKLRRFTQGKLSVQADAAAVGSRRRQAAVDEVLLRARPGFVSISTWGNWAVRRTLAMHAAMREPILSRSWKAKSTSAQPGRQGTMVLAEGDCSSLQNIRTRQQSRRLDTVNVSAAPASVSPSVVAITVKGQLQARRVLEQRAQEVCDLRPVPPKSREQIRSLCIMYSEGMIENREQLQDAVAVIRLQMGDSQGFVRLYERYHARILYYLRRMLSDAAEDSAQEVWLVVLRKIRSLRVPEAFCAWLYRIAHNQVAQHFRNQRVSISFEDNEDYAACSDQPEDQFPLEQAQQVHECLERIAPDSREILVLRFMEQMSYESMAVVLGCKLGTVKSRLFHAKRKLKLEMEKQYGHRR